MPQKSVRLSNIKDKQVYYEDKWPNPNFFEISGLPKTLSSGIHVFYLSFLDPKNDRHRLKHNSRIDVAAYDRNGKQISINTTK